jgi:sulfite exporter TauE/SafE
MSILGILLLNGLVGSLGHCTGMCGPLVVMLGIKTQAGGMPAVTRHVIYHSARVAVYVVLGAAAGGVGALFGLGSGLGAWSGTISLLLGLMLLLVGLGTVGVLPLSQVTGPGSWLDRAMGKALSHKGIEGLVLMGALNGMLPCMLVYSSLLIAASSGSAPHAALGMLVFGIGTMPVLLVMGMGAGALSVQLRSSFLKISGVLITIVGLQLVMRGLAAWGVAPHLHLGGWMIW